ncbi:MAG: hypothetical protein K9K62_08005 [Desulfobacteraceae bacterium]|nr:hypothetical protein [Desulfobacteraceae bacterium]
MKQEHIIDIVEGLFKQQPLPFLGMSALIPVIAAFAQMRQKTAGQCPILPSIQAKHLNFCPYYHFSGGHAIFCAPKVSNR